MIMIRSTVLLVLLTMLLSPILNAVVHRNVVDDGPNSVTLSQELAEGHSPIKDNSRAKWHSALHCNAHIVADIERLMTPVRFDWPVHAQFSVALDDVHIGLHLSPPVPPPLV